MSRQQRMIVAGIVVILAAFLVINFWFARTGPVETPAAVEPSPVKVELPPPAVVDLAPEAARELVAKRTEIVVVDRPPPSSGATAAPGYATVGATYRDGGGLGPFLLDLYDRDVGTVVLSAVLSLGDDRVLPAIPILVLARRDGDAFETVFALGEDEGIETPPFRLDGALELSVTLEASYSTRRDAAVLDALAAAAEGVQDAYARDRGLWAPRGEAAPWVLAYQRLLAENRSKHLPGLVVFAVDPYRPEDPRAARVVFKDARGAAIGEVALRIDVRPFLASGLEAANARRALALEVGAGRTVGDHFAATPAPLARFFGADARGIGAACLGLRFELTDRLGLSAYDASAVLRALAATHALFSPGADYGRDCLGGELEVPAPAPPVVSVERLNAVLGRIVSSMRAAAPDNARQRLTASFADSVALYDFSGVWLGGGDARVVQAAGAGVVPAAGPGQAAAYLSELPVVHVACYSAGSGHGLHRAALVQLEHDPGLWVLDVAFDRQARIAGVSLSEAGREQVCRAVGNRPSGAGACFFATTGRTYRGVDPRAC